MAGRSNAKAGGGARLASWNFKHIVNLRRIRLFQTVNLELMLPPLDIRTPEEVDEDG